ncbi:uncharacterized protein LOC135118817 [Helicoverpa armigera]|uniref:uncharacterized protein LOC135118817 n=1 Tax=Helicoverpa armigera TaxID=29058 RepID=UPI003083669C
MATKRKYYAWNEVSMNLAIESVRNNKAGLNEASRMYGVPKATLKRRLDGVNRKAKEYVQIVGSEGDLPSELETELCQHILEMESSLYGVTPFDIRQLAFELAEKNNIKNRFNKEKRIAGKKWYYAFMKRHPQLSLRQPRATSMSRATGFNKPAVTDFFNKLEAVCEKYNITEAQRIFNVDETGLSTVQRKTRKILALKGKRQVGAITSGERGTNTTAVCCANAAGNFIPPLIIFKRKRAKDELRDGAPPGAIFAFNPESGYINKDIFYLWLQHFIESVKPTPEKKVLLLLDGHASHTKNLKAITYAKQHGVVLLSFPAHTTHKMQPLDVSFFKPLSLYYIDETEKWLRQNPGRTVTMFQVSMLFGKAYSRAASVGTAASGFAKTGICPLNKDAFSDYEFIVPEKENDEISPPIVLDLQDEIDPLTLNISLLEENLDVTEPITCQNEAMTAETQIETLAVPKNIDCSTAESKERNFEFTINQISPGAKKVAQELRKRSKKAQSSLELTSTPYKTTLEQAIVRPSKPKKPKFSAKETAFSKNKITDEPEPSTSKDAKSINIEKWFCKICLLCAVEDMIQCMMCKAWVHVDCACVKKTIKKYLCPQCK